MTGLGSVSDMAFSGYARCRKESLAVHSLNHKYARQCALRTKEYGQEVYACNRRRRCGSSPWSSRRTLKNLSYSFICLGVRCCVSPTCSAQFRTSRRRCSANNFVEWRLTALLCARLIPKYLPRCSTVSRHGVRGGGRRWTPFCSGRISGRRCKVAGLWGETRERLSKRLKKKRFPQRKKQGGAQRNRQKAK